MENLKKDLNTAILLFKKRKFIESINICKELLELNPKSVEILVLISKCFLALKDVNEAKNYLEYALRIEPNNVKVLKDIGNIYLILNDTAKAKAFYIKTIDINKNYAPALTNLGILELKSGNNYEALSYQIRAEKAEPNTPSILGNLANAYFINGQDSKAEEIILKAIGLDGNNINFKLLLSSILSKLNKLDEAKNCMALWRLAIFSNSKKI